MIGLQSLQAKVSKKSPRQRCRRAFYFGGCVKAGLYANIHAKRERIKAGSGEKMRKPGAPGAPTAKAFKQAAKTTKKPAR